jgi:hypothetical protein
LCFRKRRESVGHRYFSIEREVIWKEVVFRKREIFRKLPQVPHVRGCPEMRWKPSGKREIVRKD